MRMGGGLSRLAKHIVANRKGFTGKRAISASDLARDRVEAHEDVNKLRQELRLPTIGLARKTPADRVRDAVTALGEALVDIVAPGEATPDPPGVRR